MMLGDGHSRGIRVLLPGVFEGILGYSRVFAWVGRVFLWCIFLCFAEFLNKHRPVCACENVVGHNVNKILVVEMERQRWRAPCKGIQRKRSDSMSDR